ncbi:hypothetical protein ACFE04_022023 [Oxalis oulophora]
MAKCHLLCFFIVGFGIMCVTATTYQVGDSSGWDISSDLDTWPNGKTFQIGDVLIFQYSSSDTLSEVTKPNFDSCNTSNAIKTYSSGNTTVTLTNAGEKYFISGNRLYCLGGMKLKLNVEGAADSPVGTPQPQPVGPTPTSQPSTKTNTPSTVVPTSIASSVDASCLCGLILGFLAFLM